MSANLETFFQDLQKRGLIANAANLENFYQLKPEQKVIYLGIDCTGESLHIGHLFSLIQTIRFAKEGFQILLVLGGATSKIGDPSDKLKERPQLEDKQLNQYYQAIKNQITQIVVRPSISENIKGVTFDPLRSFWYANDQQSLNNVYKILEIKKEDNSKKKWENYLNYIWPLKEKKFVILNNDDWLGKLTLIDFNKIGQSISVNYLLSKETIKQRVENPETSLSFLAFSYSLLQAYDFYYLYENYNCHGQLGGSDQWGNLTTGLKLIRGFYPENKTFAFTFKLMTDKEGKKYSKSENGKKTLRLNSEKKDLVDFFLNLSDEEIQPFIRQFTFLREKQIRELLEMPPRLRVLQKIMVELMWFLNYGDLESLKNLLETREDKVSFFTLPLLPGQWKRKQWRAIKNKAKEIWGKLSQEEEELKKEIWLLRKELEMLKTEKELSKKEKKLLELKRRKDEIDNIFLKFSQTD